MPNGNLPSPPPTLGQVLSLLTAPCAVPVFAIIGTATFSALTAWWSVVSPNWKDVIKEGPGKKSWLHQLEVVFEDTEETTPSWVIEYKEAAYGCFEFVDFFAFWFMVGEAIVDGLLNWTSMLWQMSPCAPHPAFNYVYSHSPDGIWDGFGADWQLGPNWNNLQTNTGITGASSQFTFPPNSECQFICVAQWQNFVSNQPQPMSCRVIDMDTGGVAWENNFNIEKTDGKHSIGIVERAFKTGATPKTYQIQFKAELDRPLLCNTTGGNFALTWQTYDQ